MSRTLNRVAVGWSFLIILLFVYTDFAIPKLIYISDYLMTFHVAGKLLCEGKLHDLYPPPGATSFIDAPFDLAAHRVLPDMPGASTAEFMYPPVGAVIFAPLSFLTPAVSLACWQLICILSFTGAVFLLINAIRYSDLGEKGSPPRGLFGWAHFAYLPVVITIWIGQVGLTLGLLPLSFGYWVLMHRKQFLAGLIWSVAILKPQFLVPALIAMTVQCLNRRFKTALGFVAGLAIFFLINIAVFSLPLLKDYLRCLSLSDVVYSNLKFGWQPRAVLWS